MPKYRVGDRVRYEGSRASNNWCEGIVVPCNHNTPTCDFVHWRVTKEGRRNYWVVGRINWTGPSDRSLKLLGPKPTCVCGLKHE